MNTSDYNLRKSCKIEQLFHLPQPHLWLSVHTKKPNYTPCDLNDVTVGSPAIILAGRYTLREFQHEYSDPWLSVTRFLGVWLFLGMDLDFLEVLGKQNKTRMSRNINNNNSLWIFFHSYM